LIQVGQLAKIDNVAVSFVLFAPLSAIIALVAFSCPWTLSSAAASSL